MITLPMGSTVPLSSMVDWPTSENDYQCFPRRRLFVAALQLLTQLLTKSWRKL